MSSERCSEPFAGTPNQDPSLRTRFGSGFRLLSTMGYQRVLDWTLSPKIAIHFATAEQEYFGKDGVVWCVDVVRARQALPPELLDILEQERAVLFAIEMLDSIANLEQLDHFGRESPFVLFFEPPSLDARIVNQAAVLSIMPGPELVLDEFLEAHPDMCHRVVIPSELKWEARDKLDQDNVTERMLFPGLDGLSRWLRRYYGPRRAP